MQPELSSEICELYQVLFETRQKLEFLNQIYKLRASLIDELLHPQYSTSTRSSHKNVSKSAKSASSTVTPEYTPDPIGLESIHISNIGDIDKEDTDVTPEKPYDFTQLDLLLQKSKNVRNDEIPQKHKKALRENKPNIPRKEESSKSSVINTKSDKLKQTCEKLRVQSSKTRNVPKSTYQASYSKKPFLQHKHKEMKSQICSLPQIEYSPTPSRELSQYNVEYKQQHKQPNIRENEHLNSTTHEPTLKLPTLRPAVKGMPLTFSPPYQLPSLPSEFVEALRDLKSAQIELARLLKNDQTKIFAPGKDFIRKFEELYRGDETPRDRQLYACNLYKEIEDGSIPADIKSFFLNSLQSNIASEESNKNRHTGFIYPCIHCSDVKRCSVEGIKMPKLILLKELNLCSLLSECYPGSLLSKSSLITRDRLQCKDLNQVLELQLLIIDVFSLSVKKDILSACMKVVPSLDLDKTEDRQALRVIAQILDSSNITSFYEYSIPDD
ncbi:hypothetical protein LOD99_7789 [Oopsacas minuta]|uniref:Uncharacterized protein n=1 Tax=Oopsacas minuta TaxID=111878 RepID=A0AAV7JPW2_9METZ|nr:hypothetical protein LOD99_7789 [Oopsacas minuta]